MFCLCEGADICGTRYGKHLTSRKGGFAHQVTVHTMYMKKPGENAKHEHTRATTNLSTLSNIAVQVFEHAHGRLFSSIPTATALLGTFQFACLAPSHILSLLLSAPQTLSSGGLELSAVDVTFFSELQSGIKAISGAMKEFGKREVRGCESD